MDTLPVTPANVEVRARATQARQGDAYCLYVVLGLLQELVPDLSDGPSSFNSLAVDGRDCSRSFTGVAATRTPTSVSVYYKMKKAYQCSLKCGTLGGRCGYIVERELSTMSTHPLDKESIQ